MSKALEILTKIRDEKISDCWQTMKEYRMPLRNEINEIDEAIEEVNSWIERDKQEYT